MLDLKILRCNRYTIPLRELNSVKKPPIYALNVFGDTIAPTLFQET
jgi:hypothetical protein